MREYSFNGVEVSKNTNNVLTSKGGDRTPMHSTNRNNDLCSAQASIILLVPIHWLTKPFEQ
jgi:hypothetical protein